MKDLIQKIFFASGFKLTGQTENTLFFQNISDSHQSYYLVHFIVAEQLKNYLEAADFEEPYHLFEEQKKLSADVEKNTSLLVISLSENIENDYALYKNAILQIEEDEFWFKKYILLYTNESIVNFDTETILEDLNTCILNNSQFTSFKDALYTNAEYFVAMQIFLKFPFLNVPISLNEQYLSIESILQNNLSETQLSTLNSLIDESEDYTDDFWTVIKNAATKTSEQDALTNFFLKFKAND